MLRKIVAITMFVSFIAMSTSGLMMIFISKTSFTIQMHPVHKVFGILLVIAAIAHISYNFKSLKNHIKNRSVAIAGGVLVVILTLLYGVALNNEVPKELADELNAMSLNAEKAAEGEK